MPSFTKKVFPVVNTVIEFCIFELVGTKFELKLTILILFDQTWPKREFLVENGKIVLVRASMVVTYYIIKSFRTGTDRHNGVLMLLLLLVAETITLVKVLLIRFWKSLPLFVKKTNFYSIIIIGTNVATTQQHLYFPTFLYKLWNSYFLYPCERYIMLS